MAYFRGRGRGRGGGFGARQNQFELYPQLHDEDNFPKASSVKERMALMAWSQKLLDFWKTSPYYLKDERAKKEESIDIERYSDRGKKRKLQKEKLSDFVRCTIEYVPAELARNSKSVTRGRKKIRWNQDLGLGTFDLFEKLEQKEENGKEGNKGDGEDEEDDDEIDEEEEEEPSDGDYNQNIDFDDDEDDFNMAEDIDDEGGYF